MNFTPLTTTLKVKDLVAMLNDLFAKFDEAAEVCEFIINQNQNLFRSKSVLILSPVLVSYLLNYITYLLLITYHYLYYLCIKKTESQRQCFHAEKSP